MRDELVSRVRLAKLGRSRLLARSHNARIMATKVLHLVAKLELVKYCIYILRCLDYGGIN